MTKINSNGINDKKLKIYPNPNNGIFTLEFDNPNSNPVITSIFDLTGKIVFEPTTTQGKYQFYNKDFNKGIYILKMNGEKINYKKIIFQ